MNDQPLTIPDELWDHQKKIIRKSVGKKGFGYFMEQGTGKTPTAVTDLRNTFQNHRRPLKTLILCPEVVVSNWAKEIDKWSLCGNFVQTLYGPKKKRIEQLAIPGKMIFITNYEALDMDGLFFEMRSTGKKTCKRTGKTTETYQKVPIEHKFEYLILDESHRVKSPDAERTKLVIKMADKIAYRRLLTGTPILRTAQDIWSQFRVLDHGATFGENFYAFRSEYFYDSNSGMPSQRHFPNWVLRPGMEERLNKLIYDKAVRVTKEECLDLPPLVMKPAHCQMSGEQHRLYTEMRNDLVTYLGMEACVATLALTKALRLLQILTGFVALDDGTIRQIPKIPRLKALQDILEDSSQEKIIIWSVFHANYDQIAEVCDKLKLSYKFITGRENKKQKDEAVRDFQEWDTRVVICSPQAAGTGINLTASNLSIWYSRNYSLGDRLQGLARNHRGGSEIHKKITNIDIVCPGTIDEIVLEALDSKQSIAENILAWREKI